MTVSNTQVRVAYTGDGTSVNFPIPFPFYLATDILILLAGASIATGYSISGGAGSIGTLTMAAPPVSGVNLQIVLNAPLTQIVNLVDGTAFPSSTLDQVNDRAIQVAQRLQDRIFRTLRAPDGDSGPAMLLPAASIRANSALMFDSNGNATLGVPNNQIITTGFLAPFLGLQQTAAEAQAGVTVINYAITPHTISGIIDPERYAINVDPNTTDMGVAWNAAISVALATTGSGRYGCPIRWSGAHNIITPLNWGSLGTNIVPVEVAGYGASSQLICNTPASSGALFPMDALNGWYLHDFVMCGNSAHKNDGIHAGNVAAAEAIEWCVERVTSLMCGVGLKIQNTNTGVVRDFRHWPGNNPALIVPQTVTFSDVSHGIWVTGGFAHNISIYDPVCPPNSSYNPLNIGIKIDPLASDGLIIVRPLVQTGSGSNNEVGISAVTAGSIQGLTIMGVYNEGTSIVLGSVSQSVISACTDGSTLGTFELNSGSRGNVILGVNQAAIIIQDSTCFGNTFIGCTARGLFTDGSEGANLSAQPNRYIGCALWNGSSQVQAADLGSNWRNLLTYASSMTADTWSGNTRVIRVSNGSAFTIAMAHPRNGQDVRIVLRNETSGAMGAVTWNGINTPASVPLPAAGFNRAYTVQYDSDFASWHMVMWSPADVAN